MSESILVKSRKQVQEEYKHTLKGLCGEGMSSNPRDWSLGDAVFLLQEIINESGNPLSPDMVKIVRQKGYSWLEDFVGGTPYIDAVLCMEAYARLNEIQSKMKKSRR
jgi:hypothetical protein